MLLGPASEPIHVLAAGRPDLTEHLLAPWQQLPGIQLRLATRWLGLAGTGPGSLRLAARTLTLADQVGIPAVLTKAVRYADADQHRPADDLDAARLRRLIDRRHLDSGERWLKPPAAMGEIARRIVAAASHGDDRAAPLLAETTATPTPAPSTPSRISAWAVLASPNPPSSAPPEAPHTPPACCASAPRPASSAAASTATPAPANASKKSSQSFARCSTTRTSSPSPWSSPTSASSGSGLLPESPVPAAWSTTRSLSPRPIRWTSTCSSSGSCQCAARACRTSTSTLSPRRLEVYDRIIERFGTERVAVTGMPETYRARHALRFPVKFCVLNVSPSGHSPPAR